MVSSLNVFVLLVSLGCFSIFFVAEAITAQKNSRNLMDVLSGSGKLNFLLGKYMFGIFILSAGVLLGIISGIISLSIFLPDLSHLHITGLTVWSILLVLRQN